MSESDQIFVVEHYWPSSSPEQFERVTGRLTDALATLASGRVTILHSTYVPTDETAQWVIRAPSAGAVRALFATTGVPFDRLLPAIESADARPSTSHERADRRIE